MKCFMAGLNAQCPKETTWYERGGMAKKCNIMQKGLGNKLTEQDLRSMLLRHHIFLNGFTK